MRAVQKLALIVVFGLTALASVLIIYLFDEENRQESKAFHQQEQAIERATATYLQYCMSCHGPRGQGPLYGEGWIGWPLAGEIVSENDPNLREYDDGLTPTQRNQTDDPVLRAEREQIIRDAIRNGRGLMPAWAEENGGELNDEQIDELVLLIMEGDWDAVYNEAIAQNGGVYPTPAPLGGRSQQSAPAGAATPAAAATGSGVRLEGGDIYFAPTELTVPVGGIIELVNVGESLHNFAIEGYNDDAPIDMPVGGEVVQWTVPSDLAPGTYTFYCEIPGHRASGMEGTITITEAGATSGDAATSSAGLSGRAVASSSLTVDQGVAAFVGDRRVRTGRGQARLSDDRR